MNSNTTPTTHTTVNQENNNTNVSTEKKHYRKSVIELYQESVEKVLGNSDSMVQVSSTGNEFQGLNKAILNEAKAELDFKSNIWFTKKAMEEAGMIPVSEDDYGVI